MITFLRSLTFLSLLMSFTMGASALAADAKEIMLDNGMKVIVKEDRRAPTVAHMVWYRIGSMDEVSSVTGVAHVLEHMMFQGTETLEAGEFSRRVAALGGRENAFTSKDYTGYYQQVGSANLEAVMALEADRMANLRFEDKEFEQEIRVVMEERRLRTEDQPLGKLNEALNAAAFVAHPYHHPIVGWMSDLKNMTADDARAWYDRWYGPNNAVLVVTGDVDAEKVFALAKKYYGVIPRKALPTTKAHGEPEQHGMRRVVVKAPAENPYVSMAFKVPALRDVEKDEDVYALDVLAAVLDGYDNARLNASLVRTKRVANSAGAGYSSMARGPALFVLDGVPAKGVTTEQLENHLLAEVAKIAKEGVSEKELDRVKTQLVASQIYKRDSIFGQAMEIGVMEMVGISHQKIDRIIEKLKEVTPAQVQAVAKKYFIDDTMTVATLVPLPLPPAERKPVEPLPPLQ